MSKRVILLVDSLHAEAIEAGKSRAALSASTPELISILGDLNVDVVQGQEHFVSLLLVGLLLELEVLVAAALAVCYLREPKRRRHLV
jgi:hypothetical protein